MAKMDADVSADLDILSYCFADQVRARMERRPPSEMLRKRMVEVLARVNERLADDEYIHFALEVCKDSLKDGKGAVFGEVKAVIRKR